MLLTKYIAKSCILTDMEAGSKGEALKELTHLLVDKKKLKDSSEALTQIMAREVTESTGIGKGIAVPHARLPEIKQLTCAIGRVQDGLDFTAVDRKPVHLVFLIVYPPKDQTTYLNFVATVARLLSEDSVLEKVLSAESPDALHEILEEASGSFSDRHEEKVKALKADPEIAKSSDASADLILLARLQLCEEMLESTRSGKGEIKQRIENIRGLVDQRILRHYDRLSKARKPALVPVEGDTCQGCFMRLPSKFVQQVRQESSHIHTCVNCSRYIYVV
jgi:mannitol/fructose-specific phosphotransferase system IIA component (Ntr-type)